jgi:cytochrome P450
VFGLRILSIMSTLARPEDAVREPSYDSALDAWVVSRFADVAAALTNETLVAGSDGGDWPAHLAVRRAAHRAFSADRFEEWRRAMDEAARARVAALELDGEIDLVRDLAAPWALELAALVTRAPTRELSRLAHVARTIFTSAARTTTGDTADDANAAVLELARAFAGAAGETTIDVQAFVAITHTLPAFLGSAWLTLMQQPDALARLRNEKGLLGAAVEELLRLAGPSRAVFRRAAVDTEIGGARVAQGSRVVLLLAAANRDPARFDDPDRLSFDRRDAAHLAFSRGAHFCSGAAFIRASVASVTQTLLDRLGHSVAREVTWVDGFAIRGITSLVLTSRPGPVVGRDVC